jgi:hydrogenase nickel incorporation protein HypB
MTRIVEIRKDILNKNDQLAKELRSDFKQENVFVINVVSSPGSGKTELLQKIMAHLIADGYAVGALVGDLETENDAKRLAESGAKVKQINTHNSCHLDGEMIKKAREEISWQNLDILIIENIGNLVCPASYDLGENIRIVLMSVTEGEDKPLKYPTMFNSADLCVITKMDLAEAVEFDRSQAIKNIRRVNPNIRVLATSAKNGEGVREMADLIKSYQR